MQRLAPLLQHSVRCVRGRCAPGAAAIGSAPCVQQQAWSGDVRGAAPPPCTLWLPPGAGWLAVRCINKTAADHQAQGAARQRSSTSSKDAGSSSSSSSSSSGTDKGGGPGTSGSGSGPMHTAGAADRGSGTSAASSTGSGAASSSGSSSSRASPSRSGYSRSSYGQAQQAAASRFGESGRAGYKLVQYSKGNALTLAVTQAELDGPYLLSKSKGPASAQDIAAFRLHKAGQKPATVGANTPLLMRPLARAKKVMQATFLPAGYPTSVGSNYLQYTLWQAVTNFATTANGVLASTFLLYSVGLGAGAIPTAGALNWVLKDGLGQMGTLLFGKAIAHNFDIHSKTWYFMSFLLLSTATGLEIATMLWPHAFLVMGSCANMIKGLSWMAGGSTRSVFNLSFVRDNNIADITAKNTSQYIFASLFGTAAGVSCCAYIGQSAPLALACFSALAYTSMYSAYRTVKAIPLPTLNSTRLQLLAARYLKCIRTSTMGLEGYPGLQAGILSYQQEYEEPAEDDDTCELQLPSPLEIAEMDNPLPWLVGDPRILNPGIHVGSQLDRLVEGQPALLVVLLNTFRYSRYLLVPERNAIHVVLHAEAAPRDMVQAYLQACILRKCLKTGHPLSGDNLPELRIVLVDTLRAAENLTPPFMRALGRQGWQTEKIVVEAHRRRARW